MSGLDKMKRRLGYYGNNQDQRNVDGKLRSMHAALWNSYQAEWITFNNRKYRCLINPDKLSTDYDKKEISVDFDAEMKCGDVFYWDRTKTHWLVYMEELSEEAYFRAEIIKCDYEIDVNGTPYWVYLRGPVETALVWRQKHKIEMNDLNYSLLLYITKNEETKEFFSRHHKVKFDGHNWKVAATDKYSQDGIIEVYLEEDFDNEMEDNMLIPEITVPTQNSDPYIEGPQEIHVYDMDLIYTIKNSNNGEFVVNSSKVKINKEKTTSTVCYLDVISGKSSQPHDVKLIYQKEGEDDVELELLIKSF